MYIIFWPENLKEEHSEDLGVRAKIILKCTLMKCSERMWIGCKWLRIGTNGELF
jgi:hypothetical protein